MQQALNFQINRKFLKFLQELEAPETNKNIFDFYFKNVYNFFFCYDNLHKILAFATNSHFMLATKCRRL